jgi:thioredoxin-like negative regulator of GroEL
LTDSYNLVAEIDLARNEHLEEAADSLQTALRYEPGRNDFALRLAEVYVRQGKLDRAREIAERVSKYSAGELKQRADTLLVSIGTKPPQL